MNIIYFSKLAKKKGNLSLIKNFVTKLELWYNFKVKIILLDNKIKYIKTKT